MRRSIAVTVFLLTLGMATPAFACGGLVNPNGTVALLRTTTFVGYVDGVEHYVTSFEFSGGGGEFGSIIPLPGVPTKVQRGGDWTLQRLLQEVAPPLPEGIDAAGSALRFSADSAEVLLETRIDALDITILKGGGDEVGRWAKDNGFSLTPDAPEVLDFYADRSPIFMAARFDAKAAERRGQSVGDGTPIHLTIPTPDPWVPLRILGLGLGDEASVEADVFLLTEDVPSILPRPVLGDGSRGPLSSVGRVEVPSEFEPGLILENSSPATDFLLSDLRSDKGMKWLPPSGMWLSYVRVAASAGDLKHDLAIDASGLGYPSPTAAGITTSGLFHVPAGESSWAWAVVIGLALVSLPLIRRAVWPA